MKIFDRQILIMFPYIKYEIKTKLHASPVRYYRAHQNFRISVTRNSIEVSQHERKNATFSLPASFNVTPTLMLLQFATLLQNHLL